MGKVVTAGLLRCFLIQTQRSTLSVRISECHCRERQRKVRGTRAKAVKEDCKQADKFKRKDIMKTSPSRKHSR